MKPVTGAGWACALLLLAADAGPASAAWDNVFQVCCASCGSSSYYAPSACCTPCCPQVCTTRYVQRCYYQPVTCYQTKTYYEPVTTYRTSYYYEPVTTYRYSSYYDPCSGCCTQKACPVTSYRLRSQCCPVQSWVQRSCQVPVTSYQAASYWEPVTTCCTPTSYCPPPCEPAHYAPVAPTQPQPAVTEQRQSAAVQENGKSNGNPMYERYYPPKDAPSHMPPASNNSFRPSAPKIEAPPTVRLERIVALPSQPTDARLASNDKAAELKVRLMFLGK